jgi:transcriptional regulator with XRE-family HTH domain
MKTRTSRSGSRLGKYLRESREAVGLSLRGVETETGISNAYLSQLETGKVEKPSPPLLQKLAKTYKLDYEELMRVAGYLDAAAPTSRDIFLSHRTSDKQFVRELAADLEKENSGNENLRVWLDEAEVRPGDSLPRMINEGLEKSRFIALVMTPEYFMSGSGWTDAEWHAALHSDPDNRRGRIIPLIVRDCPYIPYLLRHLRAIDFRGYHYQAGLRELISVLRGEPLPRPITHRGQLITSGTKIDRSTLIAERAIPDAYPDAVAEPERLYCNMLPVERLPKYIYLAGVAQHLLSAKRRGGFTIPSKSRLKEIIRAGQEADGIEPERRRMPSFRVFGDRIVAFHDLENPEGPLAEIVDENEIEINEVTSFLRDPELRNLLVSLLNMSLQRHLSRCGLVIDTEKQGRYFFPPKEGASHIVSWIPRKKRATRTVAKPVLKDNEVTYWRHLGAYIKPLFLANKFYILIRPTWVITHDGTTPIAGPQVGRRVARWTGPERNLQVLYHVRFWTNVLRRGRGGPISVLAGDQAIEIATVPAMIHQAYGIASDQRDLMRLLDDEAPLIAAEEDELVDIALAEQSDEELDLEETDNDEEFDEEAGEDSVE